MKNPLLKTVTLLPLFALLLLLVSRAGVAEVSVPYNNNGHVDSIDWEASAIYIDDSGYGITDETVAYSSAGRQVATNQINEGQSVGFNTTRGDDGRFVITEIWVLR